MNLKDLNEKQLADYKEEILNKTESEIEELVLYLLDSNFDYDENEEINEAQNKNLFKFLRDERFQPYLSKIQENLKDENYPHTSWELNSNFDEPLIKNDVWLGNTKNKTE